MIRPHLIDHTPPAPVVGAVNFPGRNFYPECAMSVELADPTRPVPDWLREVLQTLYIERDRLKVKHDELSAVAEAARVACVPVQQAFSKVQDAISNLEHAEQWFTGAGKEIPF